MCSAQAGGKQRGRSIEFSEPKSDEVTTNLHQLTSKKDGLKQLEEDLYKPLQIVHAQEFARRRRRSASPPPAGPVIQSKRAKELLERRKNWVFMSPEDLLAGPTVEEILKAPEYDADGQEKKELPPLERYYQRLAAKRPGGKQPQPIERRRPVRPARKTNPRDAACRARRLEPAQRTQGKRAGAQATCSSRIPAATRSPEARRAAASPILSASVTTRCRRSKCWSTRSSWTNTTQSWTRAGTRPPRPIRSFRSLGLRRCRPPHGKPAAGLGGSSSSSPAHGARRAVGRHQSHARPGRAAGCECASARAIQAGASFAEGRVTESGCPHVHGPEAGVLGGCRPELRSPNWRSIPSAAPARPPPRPRLYWPAHPPGRWPQPLNSEHARLERRQNKSCRLASTLTLMKCRRSP